MPQWRSGDIERGGQQCGSAIETPPRESDDSANSQQHEKNRYEVVSEPNYSTDSNHEPVIAEIVQSNGEISIGEIPNVREETRASGTFNDLLPVGNVSVRSANGCNVAGASVVSRVSTHLGVGGGISFRSPRIMGLVMASPFLLCFLLFGVINITAGEHRRLVESIS